MERPERERRRERRVMMGGAAVLIVALLLKFGVSPFLGAWQLREAQIDAARDRTAYLEQLTARSASLEASAARAERQLSTRARRVLRARSSTLAASATQAFLQDLADASQVVVTRLEVATQDAESDVATGGAPREPAGTQPHVPVLFSAYGDIVGVTTLLKTLASGPRVVILESLALQRNAALVGAPDVVQFTVKLRVPALSQ